MGGVLQYKWETNCRVSLSSKLRSQESTAIQMGGVLPYKLEEYCRTFSETSCRGWGFRNIAHFGSFIVPNDKKLSVSMKLVVFVCSQHAVCNHDFQTLNKLTRSVGALS